LSYIVTLKGVISHKKIYFFFFLGSLSHIERLHNSLRQRTESFRGFHGSLESANSIMKGLTIFYNYIRKHQSIKCCPYQLATDLKLNSNNKWLELIELSKK